jgi:hypothetical protein
VAGGQKMESADARAVPDGELVGDDGLDACPDGELM